MDIFGMKDGISEFPHFDITQITPLFFRCLELPDDDVQVKVINTLSNVTEGCLRDSTIMAEHTGTLISTMLENSASEEVHSTVSALGRITQLKAEHFRDVANTAGSLALLGHFTWDYSS
jgi:hypothetical protein